MIAVDTNIFVYAETPGDQSGRHAIAEKLLAKVGKTGAIVPVQVLSEFLNVFRHKQLSSVDVAIAKVANFLLVFDTPVTSPADLIDAAQLAHRHGLQFFDALIVIVAARAGATLLLSEDMQDGLEVAGLTIVNPFAPANDSVIAERLGSAL